MLKYVSLVICSSLILSCAEENDPATQISFSCMEGDIRPCVCDNGNDGTRLCNQLGQYSLCICKDAGTDSLENDVIKTELAADSITIIDSVIDAAIETSNDVLIDSVIESKCVPGTTDCMDNIPRICGQDSVWMSKQQCDFLCVEGVCKGSCKPGSTKCEDQALMFCDVNGEWKHSETCAIGCDKNAKPNQCVGHWCCNQQEKQCNCWASALTCNVEFSKLCTVKYDCCMQGNMSSHDCECYSQEFLQSRNLTCEKMMAAQNPSFQFKLVKECPPL